MIINNFPKSMGHRKSSSKREVYSDTGLPQETRKISKKQPNLPSKGIRKRRTKPNVSRRKEIIKIRAENHMVVYLENPKISTSKLLELMNEFSKVDGCKINIQKSVVFLYNNNQLLEKESKKIIPFKIASKSIKHLGINLAKESKDYTLKTIKC